MAINRVNLAVLKTFDSSNSVCHNKNKNTCLEFEIENIRKNKKNRDFYFVRKIFNLYNRMQSNSGNDVKQYNLTAGKSLPEWLDERKRRTLLKRDVELRRRLELLQEFDMPSVSSNIRISNDGDYILATGTYKPRVKCFDVNQLGLKFERCFDSEPVAFSILSEDYSKVAFLQCDRYVELHAQFGRYYRYVKKLVKSITT